MFGLSRRSALARSKSLAALPARAAVAAQPSCINTQDFHSTSSQAVSRPTWMPMRVKTPWIDALTQTREAETAGPQEKAGQKVTPDVSPKKMSDSYYSAVRILFLYLVRWKSACLY